MPRPRMMRFPLTHGELLKVHELLFEAREALEDRVSNIRVTLKVYHGAAHAKTRYELRKKLRRIGKSLVVLDTMIGTKLNPYYAGEPNAAV